MDTTVKLIKAATSTLNRDLRVLYLVTNPEIGQKAYDMVYDLDKKVNSDDCEDKEDPKLSDSDQELWDWMMSEPEIKSANPIAEKQASFITDTKRIEDLEDEFSCSKKTIKKSSDISLGDFLKNE